MQKFAPNHLQIYIYHFQHPSHENKGFEELMDHGIFSL
jgi:hypothetical protein